MKPIVPVCVVVFGLATGVTCAPETKPPDTFVPADAIDKRDLAGQWDYAVSGLGGEASDHSTCPSHRLTGVKWEIHERYIIARVPDPQGGFRPDDPGIILGAWAVRHADFPPMTMAEWCGTGRRICDVYDPDALRPWYERQYIVRTDWAENLAGAFEVERMSMGRATGDPIVYVPHLVREDPPRIRRDGAGSVVSIAVVSRILARAAGCSANVRTWAVLPPCAFPWPVACTADDIRHFRQSFRKRGD